MWYVVGVLIVGLIVLYPVVSRRLHAAYEGEDVYVRLMRSEDFQVAMEIEEECFGEYAWSSADWVGVVKQPWCVEIVVEAQGAVVGYLVYDTRCARAGTIDILNLAVLPAWRRRGLATTLVEQVLTLLGTQGVVCVRARVRERNLGAQLLFRELGFRAVKVLHDSFETCDEDAIIMVRTHRAAVRGEVTDRGVRVSRV
jgi:[ribosomal protein S18]-alanine N-acetyltransferase